MTAHRDRRGEEDGGVEGRSDAEITGPYKYENDAHPCFIVSLPDRTVASVYIIDEDEDRAFQEAQYLAQFFSAQRAELISELRSLADCDARAGEPLGKCMRRAADFLAAASPKEPSK